MKNIGLNEEELRKILRSLDRACVTYIRNENEREAVQDVVSDLTEYLLMLNKVVVKQEALLRKVAKRAGCGVPEE